MLFCKFVQFTIIFFREAERRAQKAEEQEKAVCPEVPERAQERREQGEGQRRAEHDGGERVEPELSHADAQGVGKEREEQGEGVERVERVGEGAASAAERAQCVVEQGEPCAEQERAQERAELFADGVAHRQPPKSRRSSPPSETVSS